MQDYQTQARASLKPDVWSYLSDGDSQGNEDALRHCQLMPRPLRDLRGGHTRLNLFGHSLDHPLLLAPVAYQRLFHAQGECASAMAAAAQGGQFLLSSLASQPFASVVKAFAAGAGGEASTHAGAQGGVDPGVAGSPGPWFQLYWQGDRERTARLRFANRTIEFCTPWG